METLLIDDDERSLHPSAVNSLPKMPIGWTALAFGATDSGTLLIVADDHHVAENRFRGQSDFDPEAFRCRIVEAKGKVFTFDGDRLTEHFEFPLETSFPCIEQLPYNRWLIVASRTAHEPNARVFTEEGDQCESFMLGDGISHVQVDGRGRIWVGWFDEGVFGNHEWKVLGREWPPSSNTVACFDAHGAVLWEPGLADDDLLADCYALNIASESAWAWTYMGGPIRRFEPGAVAQKWTSDLAGASAIAIDGVGMIVAGGYGEAVDQIALLRLDGEGVATTRRRWKLALPPQQQMETSASAIIGRSDQIHVIAGGEWRRWTVSHCVATAGG